MTNFLSTFLPEITISILGLVVFFQILYYVILFFRFSFHKQKLTEPKEYFPVSIVLVAKNEAHLLIKTLPKLLQQDYPYFEVVVVNDNSDDATPQLIKDFQTHHPNLKLIHLESSVTNIKGKKFPLSLGIKAASYEHVLLTDAHCFPASTQWVKLVARHFNDSTKIVLGFNSIKKKIGFFNALIRFDKLHKAIQYFSYCLAKIPFMGEGQNLAYTKTVFFNNKGFASQNHLRFGDDDLFVNQVATGFNCTIEYQKDAHTISPAQSNFRNWVLLKTFRTKTLKLYRKNVRFFLRFYHFLITFFYLALGFAIYINLHQSFYLLVVASIVALKFIFQYISFGFAAAKLNETRLIPHILLFDILFAALNPLFFTASIFKK
ncbi:MAG: glycosyltransferase [Lentimicrobiaceae bacterium]|nr:glycosyltransferase [Lentimicrobiaceae bacterium]